MLHSQKNKKIQLAAFTAGDSSGASSRLRSYYLFSEAKKFGFILIRPSKFIDGLSSDIVHIQKIYSYNALFWTIIFRCYSKKVIFDIDDQINKRKEFIPVFLTILFSSTLTTDSKERKKYWEFFFPFKRIELIHDVADKKQINLTPPSINRKRDPYTFFWIGNTPNFHSIGQFMDKVVNDKRYSLLASLHKDDISFMKDMYPRVNFVPWRNGIAFSNKINAKFMILNHDCDKNSSMKSDNKMVLAILAGYYPIVSNTSSYSSLAKKLNANFLIYKDITEAFLNANYINKNVNTKIFFNHAFTYINQNYSRTSVFIDFYNKVIM